MMPDVAHSRISTGLLEALFRPFWALADDPDDPLNRIDDNDEPAIRKALNEQLPLHFARFNPVSQMLLKRATAFYLQKPGFDFDDFWNGYLPPFSASGKDILQWSWEILFPHESVAEYAEGCVEDPAVTWRDVVYQSS